MILFRTTQGAVVEERGRHYTVPEPWDEIFNREDLFEILRKPMARKGAQCAAPAPSELLAPIVNQEIWAAGVTYARSRTARMSESKEGGGANFYDRIYHATRPELFFKATAHRTVGPGGTMHLRRDSHWIVPEPELTLAINRSGNIIGYTIGNDLSCRDLEGENPLYLPQAKTFTGCAGLGPGILIRRRPLPRSTSITLDIRRRGRSVHCGEARLAQIRKPLSTLVEYLLRDNAFPAGCFLMTGTGIVPPGHFCLHSGDEVRIGIEPIGTLINHMK
jgi:2-dehydro-3-deoxy-D-arabinonate dehydratase